MIEIYILPLLTLHNVAVFFGFLWAFWALYVFTMGVYRAVLADRLRGLNYVLALPIVLVAVIVDVLTNLIIAPILFLDLPRELMVTTRLVRYMNGPKGWRQTVAKVICDGVLDVFDPNGNHC